MMDYINPNIVAHLGLIFIVFNLLVLSAAFMVWMERKVCAYIQDRVGPNRVGYAGWLQPFADVIKLLTKEELRPKAADALLFAIAPVISAAAAFAAFAVVPFGTSTTLFGLLDEPMPLQVTDVNVGVLVLFAITSMGIYGIVLAGWASNSKYSLLGGLRSAAQMISYELSFGLGLAAVVVMAGSLSLREIVGDQSGYWFGFIPQWYVFLQPVGFLVFMIAGVAETNRAPFDVAEGESEIVAGFHVEYSGVAFAIFFLAEYANMILVSFLAALLFLGGWLSPFQGLDLPWISAPGMHWLLLKALFFAFAFVWFRASFPRYRYDQIMRLGWKVFIPITIVWIFVTAIAAYLNWFEIGV